MTVRPAALLLVVFIASSPGVSFAQQADPGATPVASDAATADQNANAPASREEFPDETLFLKTLPYDIAGADYYSLVAWLRSLGLSDTGGVEELRSRLYAHYGVNAPAAAKTGGRVIVIESASSSRYVPGEGGDAGVTLSGGVVLTIVDDAAGESIRLEADSVRINRDASLLSARGRVRFERKKADGTEFFRGELLELDLNDRSGLFKEGQSEKGSGDDRLVFRADDITSKGGGVLVLSDGTISSCDEDYPHYSIRASKIWILGGNEWAMLDATLSVGELPVLWLPFFFYPGEEIVFHPVFGYDSRLGRFVQTTTYFLGEKPSKEESLSLFKLAGGAQSEKREVRGFFLRGTGQKKTGASDDFVKLFVDLYTNIGSFVGVNAKLNKLGPVTAFNAFAGLAVSRSLFALDSGAYTPFVEAGGYESVWHESMFLGLALPFRFGVELSGRLAFGSLNVSLSLPLYSDPFFDQDFLKRSEDMDWLSFMKAKETASTISQRTSFTDRVDLSWTLPSASMPAWMNSFSISRLASSLSWASRQKLPVPATGTDASKLYQADPARLFFYPDQLTYLDYSASASGTIFNTAATDKASPSATKADRAGTGPGTVSSDSLSPYRLPEPVSPWENADGSVAGDEVTAPAGTESDFILPALVEQPASVSGKADSASLVWQLSSSGLWNRRFKNSLWLTPEDVDWSPLYELNNARVNGSLVLNSSILSGLFAGKLSLTGSTQFQSRPIAEDTTLKAAWAMQDAQYRTDKLSGGFQLTGSPLLNSWLWSPTSLSYSLDASIYDYSFAGMVGGEPTYDTNVLAWDKDRIKAHALNLTIGARPGGFNQSVSLQANLPPLLESYTGKLALRHDYASFNSQIRYYRPGVGSDFTVSPITSQLSLGKSPLPVLSSTFVWDVENERPSTLSSMLSWDSLSASFAMRRAIPYTLAGDPVAWEAGAEAFRPAELQFSYTDSWSPPPQWKNRISWTFNASANARQSFLRFSDSYMDVSFSFKFKVHDFLDLSFSSTSRNSSLWRYYPGAFSLPAGLTIEPVNPLIDILKSFNFSNAQDRMDALFKLKSLSIKAVHDLHDWDLSYELSLQPVQKGLSYEFKPLVTVLLGWRSVPEIKTSYKLDGETETWN